ncbi:MAG: dienelactone hydrolase family protein [Xanthomonadaceae bacterium]|jgi:carboxymethylenebutenolidase|nr:dienelactone hydrolase family protein [Xanthomonadaceae bacterium]
MSRWIVLDTSFGPVSAWEANPVGKPPRAGLIVMQEIFGVNMHIRSIASSFARAGYAVLAPAFFDPIRKKVELGYSGASFSKGRKLADQLGFNAALEITRAARDRLAPIGKVGSVGYCWGGAVALLAAIRLGLPSVSYYGARNVEFLDDAKDLKVPVMFHFGEKDPSISVETIRKHRELPHAQTFVYPAGHAFNRDVDPRSYDPLSAELAQGNTLVFFAEHLQQ